MPEKRRSFVAVVKAAERSLRAAGMKHVYGSEQDVEDALGIYVRQRKRLGLRRMRQFASRQGVLDDLRDLEREAVEIKDGAPRTLEREIARARRQVRSGKTVSLEQLRREDD